MNKTISIIASIVLSFVFLFAYTNSGLVSAQNQSSSSVPVDNNTSSQNQTNPVTHNSSSQTQSAQTQPGSIGHAGPSQSHSGQSQSQSGPVGFVGQGQL